MNHFKTSFYYIRRAPFQAFAAVFSLMITFFVATTVVVFVYASSRALNYFETRPQVIAFIKTDAKQDAIESLQAKLQKDDRVRDVKYVTRESALDIYKKATADNPVLGELVSPSSFPASLEFSLKELENATKILEEIKKEQVVESVGFTANVGGQSTISSAIDRLKSISYTIKIIGVGFCIVLAASSSLVLVIVLGIRIASRKEEIDTLSLIGARSGFISSPLVIEALYYGLVGAFLGWFSTFVLLLYSSSSINKYLGVLEVIPRKPSEFFVLLLFILACELGVSFLLALFASTIAISRSMPKRR